MIGKDKAIHGKGEEQAMHARTFVLPLVVAAASGTPCQVAVLLIAAAERQPGSALGGRSPHHRREHGLGFLDQDADQVGGR